MMRLRWGLALGALSFVSACEVVLGLDGAVSSYDDLSFCSCPALDRQDTLLPPLEKFTPRCETAIDVASKAQFDDFIAQDCNACPLTVGDLGDCYATLTNAAEVGEPCTAHADCRSLACCLKASPNSEEPGTCCETCAGCSTLDQAADPDDVCVDLPERLAAESAESCKSCQQKCDESFTLFGLKNCAACIESDCPTSCTRWEDRPIKDESAE